MTAGWIDDLAFEAGFLGRPVWRLNDPDRAVEAAGLAEERSVGLMSCRVLSAGSEDKRLLRAGFRHVETLVSLRRPVRQAAMPLEVCVAAGSREEANACGMIGRSAFKYDRFHADERIADSMADDLKESWVRNAVLGRADCVLLHRDPESGGICGFNACLRKGDEAVIDLIGIAPVHQRRGIGGKLLAAMDAHYCETAGFITLGTQLANKASLGFYARDGFTEIRRQDTWHWMPETRP